MPILGKASAERLATCHPDLQRLFQAVIERYDFTVTCGHRGQEEQEEAFRTGRSKVRWPNGKHNTTPSLAVDAVPYPVDWNDLNRFYFFAGYVLATAAQMGIEIRWGGDWDGDFNFREEKFADLPHFELVTRG